MCSLSALLALGLLVVPGDEGARPVVLHVTLDEVPVDRHLDEFLKSDVKQDCSMRNLLSDLVISAQKQICNKTLTLTGLIRYVIQFDYGGRILWLG